ncbi:MAG: thioredoxin domain-containing protein [Sphingobacteriia bacterium]|nr:thioredoxin domain-containing protein [Sphingobacteriia bacterium]
MHTNLLIHETSPYLLQHAHNPVNWYPWSEAALQKAKEENKPILISIGYAACHWCHVMEKESFEDENVAALMNKYFINIKIDREERPDLDHIYMDAVQAMTGSGGWPLNVFLTPDAKPFYGGTYFPPVAAHNRMSWADTITAIYKAFTEKRNEVDAQAESLTEHLVKSNGFGMQTVQGTVFNNESLFQIAENILKQADASWGGFGKAPKFPQTFSIQYLLRHYHFSGDELALKQALLSLDKMIDGGIYDQVGGGFARYSTDNEWLAPHFEKMLYDNALIVSVIAEAYQITRKEKYKYVIEQTVHFLQRELLHADGYFFSALDADSEGVEGKFYTWSLAEIKECLGQDAALVAAYFNITEKGNWEHTNILWVKKNSTEFALEYGIAIEDLMSKIERAKTVLLQKRNERPRPLTDDKALLGWNALMCYALCKAYAATKTELYRHLALSNMEALEKYFKNNDQEWKHSYKKEIAKIPAFLDDYAYLIQAYIQLQEITGQPAFLEKAKTLTEKVIAQFSEPETGFFFYTPCGQQDVIIRKKEVYDGATPSGNAVMAANLYYLSVVFNYPHWQRAAEKMLQSLHNAIVKYPTSFGAWAALMQTITVGLQEIVIVGREAATYLPELLSVFMPNKVLQSSDTKNDAFSLLMNRYVEEKTFFYLCKNHVCEQPEADFIEFLHLCNIKSSKLQ